MTNFERAKQRLVKRYTAQRTWRQATDSYGFWVYPHDYYSELIDIVLRWGKR